MDGKPFPPKKVGEFVSVKKEIEEQAKKQKDRDAEMSDTEARKVKANEAAVAEKKTIFLSHDGVGRNDHLGHWYVEFPGEFETLMVKDAEALFATVLT